MDKCQFSEFSYGYCLTEDLVVGQGTPLSAAPVFPSLIEEGQPNGGYDLKLNKPGTPLFLQFKLVHQMVRGTANEARKGHFKEPFYRMHLRSSGISDQHQSLLFLEQAGNDVFYAAPSFHTLAELDLAYAQHTVWNRTFRVRPSQIGPLPNDKQHHVTFQSATGNWRFYSEESSRSGHGESTEVISSGLQARIMERGERNLRQQVEELDQDLIEIVNERNQHRPERERIDVKRLMEDLNPVRRVAYIARQFFDCQLLFVTFRD
jgi:hypothetical protein